MEGGRRVYIRSREVRQMKEFPTLNLGRSSDRYKTSRRADCGLPQLAVQCRVNHGIADVEEGLKENN